jgi:probable addiction module antidote protein
MPKRTKPYESWQLEKLSDPKLAAGYLNASLMESPELFLVALGKVAQAHQMSRVAREAGVQRETLYRSLSEQGNPTFDTLSSILKSVGLKISIEVATTDRIVSGGRPFQPYPISERQKR